jgi:hypothetical protein
LGVFAADGHVADVRRVFGSAGFATLELVTSSVHMTGCGESDFAVYIVPFERDATSWGAGPVASELALGAKRG